MMVADSTEAASLRPGSGAMFDRIARRYDLLNRIISMGLDRGWRRHTVAALGLRPGHRVLDLATGTADVALEVLAQAPETEVIGVDPSAEMLQHGEVKVEAAGASSKIRLQLGEAESLPFPDASFDGLTISFGIRNVADRPRALREMARVVRPDGRIAILEASEPPKGLLGALARWHVHVVIPWLGSILSGAKEYRYLQTSIAAFPEPPAFAEIMREAGLEVLAVRPLTFGVCCLYVARPAEARPAEARPAAIEEGSPS